MYILYIHIYNRISGKGTYTWLDGRKYEVIYYIYFINMTLIINILYNNREIG